MEKSKFIQIPNAENSPQLLIFKNSGTTFQKMLPKALNRIPNRDVIWLNTF